MFLFNLIKSLLCFTGSYSNDVFEEPLSKEEEEECIINKENSGYGASVNQGLDKASGEYIAIVEADDFIDKRMFKNLYNLAIERGSVDIINLGVWERMAQHLTGKK